jgi:hypothetical protein
VKRSRQEEKKQKEKEKQRKKKKEENKKGFLKKVYWLRVDTYREVWVN